MNGASYKEVVEFMDSQDGSRRANPFEAMTNASRTTSESVVSEKPEESSEE
jgi:hypothetical protein